ncbi:MAG TPA: hypothetical protein VMG38_25640 [Trebonia sp.]|nr:hypothetical protein [Trebonia sp.]
MGQVHSVLVRTSGKPRAVAERLAAPWLRPYVVGYCAFRTGPQAAGWRVLPLALVVVVVEPDQPHFNREIKAMAGVTPSELRAFVQYKDDLLD